MRINKTAFLTALLAAPAAACASEGPAADFPVWTAVFFAGLLLSIAVCPLVNSEWWGKKYGYVSIGFAIPAAVIVTMKDGGLLLHVMQEYVSFIILLGSLFVIAGGIVIKIGPRGTPKLNLLLLLAGTFFASFIGTTGASMILIRPMIRANRWRRHISHIFIFFIFLVSNIGGLLTPLGDPPLYLGFLRGVPFLWTFNLAPILIFTAGIVLALFYIVDSHYLKKEDEAAILDGIDEIPEKNVEIKGAVNLLFLGLVVASFFMPAVIREIAMVTAAGLSVYFTSGALREENAFTYHPIKEVALLFFGIFVTMAPALSILQANGGGLGVTEPWSFFWASGTLSSLLDNAPTYLVFFATAQSVAAAQGITENLIMGVPEIYLTAISVGAVFMGANTYIGNGPNFMVKAICEENEINMPSFFGYMAWSCAILIPVFILVTFIFF
jgi:Na+/H+ antiporter NhaD/arsenite permease-like protein